MKDHPAAALTLEAALRGEGVAVLIPCYNEATTIEKVVADFRLELPEARIYVFDNNSSDATAELAAAAGAIVVREGRQGKGFVVRSMFDTVEADLYVMVDGDDTYPAARVHDLIKPVAEGRADMSVGNRLVTYEDDSYRPLHVFGNRLVVRGVNFLFGSDLQDVMSGYRVFHRRLVKTIPIVSRGFEIETQMTVQALHRSARIAEVPIEYGTRPEGSVSKLSTYRDGAKVLLTLFNLFKAYRPLLFFAAAAALVGGLGFLLGLIPIVEFLQTGLVTHFPTAILAAAIEIIAFILLVCGLIMDSVNHHFAELSQLVLKQHAVSRETDPLRG